MNAAMGEILKENKKLTIVELEDDATSWLAGDCNIELDDPTRSTQSEKVKWMTMSGGISFIGKAISSDHSRRRWT